MNEGSDFKLGENLYIESLYGLIEISSTRVDEVSFSFIYLFIHFLVLCLWALYVIESFFKSNSRWWHCKCWSLFWFSLFQSQDESRQQSREYEETKKQIEEDADREILDIKNKYERRLREEKEANLRLKGETGIMRKKVKTMKQLCALQNFYEKSSSHPGQSFPLSLCGPNFISRANAHMVYG